MNYSGINDKEEAVHQYWSTVNRHCLSLFPEALREANGNNKDLTRQVNDLTTIRVSLEAERDNLAADLADTRDALSDAQARLDAANNALSALRSELENRLREKDDELENIR